MSSEIAIAVQCVSKRYEMYAQPRDRLLQFLSMGKRQYFKEFWALRNVSFNVGKGETIGILGRNGSGKSTLLQIIAGTLSPTSGEVYSAGVMAALLELGSGFNPDFTGRENIYLNGTILGFSQAEMDARFDDIAAFADIGEHLDQPIKTYSSGMVVRLAFAVQACVSPQVLIVDEALSVGDEKFQRKCFNYIEKLRDGGCAILLVTHSTSTVEKFCQRGVLLHRGEVHGIGPAKEIVDQYHALLYSDEKAYLRYQAARQSSESIVPPIDQINAQTVAAELGVSGQGTEEASSSENLSDAPAVHNEALLLDLPATPNNIRAVITNWVVTDIEGNRSEQFRTGEKLIIRFFVDVLNFVEEIQAGILLRTVEGVSAFGTSTLYHEKNFKNARSKSRLVFDFELTASLCAGSYFVTLAIAEAISDGDMLYLDKKTDAIVIKIHQSRTLAGGIAMLDTTVRVINEGGSA